MVEEAETNIKKTRIGFNECKDLHYAKKGNFIFYRRNPHSDLFSIPIMHVTPDGEITISLKVIATDDYMDFYNEGYYYFNFLPDGRSTGKDELDMPGCSYSVYPMSSKYKAIQKIEQEYALRSWSYNIFGEKHRDEEEGG